MDDFLKLLPNVADLIDLSKIVMLVLQCYGFRIIKWISNSPEILHSLPASEISKKYCQSRFKHTRFKVFS